MQSQHYSIGIKAAGLALILTMVLGLTACAGGKDKKAEAGADAAQKTAAEEAILVKTQPAAVTKFEGQVEISGNAAPYEQAVAASKISGDVVFLAADMGAYVKKGQVLAKIDDARYMLTKEKIGLGLEASKLNMSEQEKDINRLKELYKENAISQKELEAALNGMKLSQIGLKQGQNDMKAADLNLRDTSVKAPISGYVTLKKVNVGENVSPGTVIYNLADTGRLYLDTGIAEDLINDVTKGMKVKLTFPALKNAQVEGTVEQINQMQDAAKLYGIRILIANPDGKIKPGMFASGLIERSSGVEGMGVPKIAVLHSEGKDYVFIAENGKAVRKEIVVGLGNTTFFQVKKGLSGGEQVVVVGQEKLQDGSLLKVQP